MSSSYEQGAADSSSGSPADAVHFGEPHAPGRAARDIDVFNKTNRVKATRPWSEGACLSAMRLPIVAVKGAAEDVNSTDDGHTVEVAPAAHGIKFDDDAGITQRSRSPERLNASLDESASSAGIELLDGKKPRFLRTCRRRLDRTRCPVDSRKRCGALLAGRQILSGLAGTGLSLNCDRGDQSPDTQGWCA